MGHSPSQLQKPRDGNVLADSMGGGPLGLGDPDDRTLRHVEKDVLIPSLMRERLRTEFCVNEWKAWIDCGKEKTWRTPLSCKGLLAAVTKCHHDLFDTPEFRQETQELYLKYRKVYRNTGHGHKIIRGSDWKENPNNIK